MGETSVIQTDGFIDPKLYELLRLFEKAIMVDIRYLIDVGLIVIEDHRNPNLIYIKEIKPNE